MPRYLVARTFADGLAIPADEAGPKRGRGQRRARRHMVRLVRRWRGGREPAFRRPEPCRQPLPGLSHRQRRPARLRRIASLGPRPTGGLGARRFREVRVFQTDRAGTKADLAQAIRGPQIDLCRR
jgi:hypothetical protein